LTFAAFLQECEVTLPDLNHAYAISEYPRVEIPCSAARVTMIEMSLFEDDKRCGCLCFHMAISSGYI
jgi:hypothetical protein